MLGTGKILKPIFLQFVKVITCDWGIFFLAVCEDINT